jgi:hypothetical protein
MLKEIEIPIDNLLLDPNNPRFIRDLTMRERVPEDEIEAKQADTLKAFSGDSSPEEPEFDVTNIRDLYDSMLRIGFVGIDRIVVRPLGKSKRYIVLEGNRRIATVKHILQDLKNSSAPLDKPAARNEAESHRPSFEKVKAMLLETAGLSQDEINHKVAILLGIRHHGSVLEWEPLPKAYNCYTEYMGEEPKKDSFEFEHKKAKAVANRLCIQKGDVTDALRTYVAYLQVRERFSGVRDDHYSLIESAIKNKYLKGTYFCANEETFELDEQSLTRLNVVCQFATRDSNDPERTTDKKKKILPDPKSTRLLGQLIEKRQHANHNAVKDYASDLIKRAENEDDLEMTLDEAVNQLVAFERRTAWTDAIDKLLQKQVKELAPQKYAGEGLDRGRKEEIKATLAPLRKIMSL